MSNQIDFSYSRDDIDITKYLILLIRNYRIIILFILISIICNLILNSYKTKSFSTELEIRENNNINFIFSPQTIQTLEQIDYSPDSLFKLQKNNYLDYSKFLIVYDTFNEKIKKSILPRDMFISLEYQDLKVNEENEIGKYIFHNSFDPEDSIYILSKLVSSSELNTFNTLLDYLEKKKSDIKRNIATLKNKMIFNINLDIEFQKLQIEKNIELLEENYLIAKSMGYDEPVLNYLYENEFLLKILEEEQNDPSVSPGMKKPNMTNKELFYQGTKILNEQMIQSKNRLEKTSNMRITDNDDMAIILARTVEYRLNWGLYNDFINQDQALNLAINEIKLLRDDDRNGSILTEYNLDRIIVNSSQISIFYTYLIAVALGIFISASYIIVRENINNRISKEPILTDQAPVK